MLFGMFTLVGPVAGIAIIAAFGLVVAISIGHWAWCAFRGWNFK